MKQDVFSLAEGEVVLSWPTPLSADSVEDLKAWLQIMERKITRSRESYPDPVHALSEHVGRCEQCNNWKRAGVKKGRIFTIRAKNF
jgi:hypothetical protein